MNAPLARNVFRSFAALGCALALFAAPAAAYTTTYSVKITAFDASGRALDAARLAAYIGRADKRGGPGLWGWSPDGLVGVRPVLSQKGESIVLTWDKIPRLILTLPWPVTEDGFSTVLIDRDGRGLTDGDAIKLNEEVALTQYRHFKESWTAHLKDREPLYDPSPKARRQADRAKEAIAEAQLSQDPVQRAKLFDRALRDVSLAWQKLLVEHGSQLIGDEKLGPGMRFGLTLDDTFLKRLDHYQWLIQQLERSGSNWVRLVFRANPADFLYAKQASFNEYDAVVKELRARNIRIMGCVLDTTQWPASLSPSIYAERSKNLALHFKGQINSWELGSELNGNWLGGRKSPLSAEDVFGIFQAAASELKKLDPGYEIVATLYWWEGTAPDQEHTLNGWLTKFVPKGFPLYVDAVAVSLWPEDNPVGLSLERIFQRLHQFLPEKKLMIGSYGYVEGEELKGYWWLDPKDVDGARKDLVTLYTPAACAFEKSSGGGFWWQTLDQMLPEKGRMTDLFKVYRQSLRKLGK
jgi:hypothetical protein